MLKIKVFFFLAGLVARQREGRLYTAPPKRGVALSLAAIREN
jgi:hypothetical protein